MTLLHPDSRYQRFVFVAPKGQPTAWRLSYERVEEALRRVDPKVVTAVKVSKLREISYLSYQATFPFGWFEGTSSLNHNLMTFAEATLGTATGFATWLRRDIVPQGVGIEFNFLPGIEMKIPPGLIPDTTDADVIAAVLEKFVRRVLRGDE